MQLRFFFSFVVNEEQELTIMKFRISFTTALFFFMTLTTFLPRSDSSRVYKHISPNISSKVPYTTVEDFEDSYSNIKSAPYTTEQTSNDRQHHQAEFTSTIAQGHSKNVRRNQTIFSRSRLNSEQLSSNSLPQKSQAECESSPIPESAAGAYAVILSPDVFVQVDPLHYLFSKIENLSFLHSVLIKTELITRLQFKKIPQCYIPFAKVLWAILQCWSYLLIEAQGYMEEIRARRTTDIDSSFSLPEEITSSYELSKLYSSDILNDREPARRLLFAFLDMSEDSIGKLKTELSNFLKNSFKYSRPYSYSNYCIGFAQALFYFLEKELAFGSIKRYVDEIKSKPRMQTSNQNS